MGYKLSKLETDDSNSHFFRQRLFIWFSQNLLTVEASILKMFVQVETLLISGTAFK